MAQQTIDNGDTGLVARTKINENFTEVYARWVLTGTSTLTGAVTIAGTSTNTQTHQFNALGATVTDCFLLDNNTDAAAGAQQYSPFLRWRGRGWKTNATAASQTVDFDAGVTTTQGSSSPTGNWLLRSSIDGGAYTTIISIANNPNVGTVFHSGALSIIGTTNGTVTLGGSGTLRIAGAGHAGKIQYNITSVLPGSAAIQLTNLNANVTATSGTHSEIGIGSGFAPTSGTAVYNMVIANQTINQTGGANGDVTLFNLAPVYTSVGNDATCIRYNPTVTSITGDHYFINASSGRVLLGGLPTSSAGLATGELWNNTGVVNIVT